MITCSDNQLERVHQTYAAWWQGALERPVIPMQLMGFSSPGGPLGALRAISERVGSARGIQLVHTHASSLAEAERQLAEFGVPL